MGIIENNIIVLILVLYFPISVFVFYFTWKDYQKKINNSLRAVKDMGQELQECKGREYQLIKNYLRELENSKSLAGALNEEHNRRVRVQNRLHELEKKNK